MLVTNRACAPAGLGLVLLVVCLIGCHAKGTSGPDITASPNPPPPAGRDAGRTTIVWRTVDARPARVVVSVNGKPEQLFASGPSGTQQAPWISENDTYEFRLYDVGSNALMAAVKIRPRATGASGPVIAVALLLAVGVIVAGFYSPPLRRACRRLVGRPAARHAPAPTPAGSGERGTTAVSTRACLFWSSLVALVVGVKLTILALDGIPRVFLGDSGVYLFSSLTGSIPPDRSFTYGRVIRLLAGHGHDIGPVIAAAVMASAASALVLGAGLRLGFGVPYRLVAVGTMLVTVEPLWLAYERFIMTETLAGFCYALLVGGGVCYLKRPRMVLLIGLVVGGVALLSLRLNAVFVTWIVALAAPLLAWRRLSSHGRSVRPWLHVGVALLTVATTHTAYRLFYGYLQDGPAAYHYGGGRFALMFAAPLVTADDFPDVGVAGRILSDVKVPLRLPRHARYPLHVRDAHGWTSDGIAAAIRRHSDSLLSADALARTVAEHAVARDPLGAFGLGLLTLRSYFDPTLTGAYDPSAFAVLVLPELGPTTLPREDELLAYRIGPASVGPSLTRTWHVAGALYYPFILLCPLVAMLAAALCPRDDRPACMFVVVVSAATVVTGPFLAASTAIRYLHPLAWMNVFAVMLVAHGVTSRRRAAFRRG